MSVVSCRFSICKNLCHLWFSFILYPSSSSAGPENRDYPLSLIFLYPYWEPNSLTLLSVISYQLSVVGYQLSVVGFQFVKICVICGSPFFTLTFFTLTLTFLYPYWEPNSLTLLSVVGCWLSVVGFQFVKICVICGFPFISLYSFFT